MEKISVAVAEFHLLNSYDDNSLHLIRGLRMSVISALVNVNSFKVASQYFVPANKKDFDGYAIYGSISFQNQNVTALIAVVKNGVTVYDHVFKEKVSRLNFLSGIIAKPIIRNITSGKVVSSNQYSLQELSPKAYQDFCLAEFKLNKHNPDAIRESIALYKNVIKLEPNYSYAYTGMAKGMFFLLRYGLIRTEKCVEIKDIVNKALVLDPENVEAYTTKASLAMYIDKDFVQAGVHFENALSLQKDFPLVYTEYIWFLVGINQDRRALKIVDKSLEYDPLSLDLKCSKADIYTYMSEFEKASQLYKEAYDLDNSYRRALVGLTMTYAQLNNKERAFYYLDLYMSKLKNPLAGWSNVGAVAAVFNDGEKLQLALSKMRERKKKEPEINLDGDFMWVYAMMKDKKAIAFMKKVYASGSGLISVLRATNGHFSWLKEESEKMTSDLQLDLKPIDIKNTPESILHIRSELSESLTIRKHQFVYAKAEGNYCQIFYKEDAQLKNMLLRIKMNGLDEQISDINIMRIHKSYMINRKFPDINLVGNAHKSYFEIPEFKAVVPVSRSAFRQLK